MRQDVLKALVAGLAKGINSAQELAGRPGQSVTRTVKTAYNAELNSRVGYDKQDSVRSCSGAGARRASPCPWHAGECRRGAAWGSDDPHALGFEHAREPDQRQPDQCRRIITLESLEQRDTEAF